MWRTPQRMVDREVNVPSENMRFLHGWWVKAESDLNHANRCRMRAMLVETSCRDTSCSGRAEMADGFLVKLLGATFAFNSSRRPASQQVVLAQAQQLMIMLCQTVLLMLLYASAGLLTDQIKRRADLAVLPHRAIENSEAILWRSCGEPCVEVLLL